MAPRVRCIVHPAAAARNAGRPWQQFRDAARRRGIGLALELTQHPGHAVELARAAPPDTDVLMAVGGDGTVNEVGTGLLLAGRETPLTILPLGTGNDFATETGLRAVEDTLDAVTGGRTRRVDAIEVQYAGGRRFALCFGAVGFAGELLRHTTPRVKRWFGARFCYWVGFFRAIRHYASPRMRVTYAEGTFEGPLFHVCAGNIEYAGGGVMRLSPGARCDDGELELCWIEALSRREVLREFPRLLRGTHPSHPKARYFRGRSLRVESDPPYPLQIDGELVGGTPATFQVVPAALTVLVPPAGAAK